MIIDSGNPAISSYVIDAAGYYVSTNVEAALTEIYEALTTNVPAWDLYVNSLRTAGDIQVDGDDILDSSGLTVISFDGAGDVDQIGSVAPVAGDVLVWSLANLRWQPLAVAGIGLTWTQALTAGNVSGGVNAIMNADSNYIAWGAAGVADSSILWDGAFMLIRSAAAVKIRDAGDTLFQDLQCLDLQLHGDDLRDSSNAVILSSTGLGVIDVIGNFSCNIVFTGAQTVDGVDISAISLSNMPTAATGNIDAGAQAITNVGNVDGVDVSALNTAYGAHLHDTDILQLDGINSNSGLDFTFTISANLLMPDADIYMLFGRAFIGHIGAGSYAGFGHRLQRSAGNYALIQSALGDTILNCAAGRNTFLYVAGAEIANCDASGLQLGGANARVTTIFDEDNMVTNSATALATQQSIKAYVDAHVPIAHVHDTDTLQLDGVNSNIGAFPFTTTGTVTFNQDIIVQDLQVAGDNINDSGGTGITFDGAGNVTLAGTLAIIGALTGVTTLAMDNQLTNTLAIGTPPFVITSTTVVPNLNVDQVDGYDMDQAVLQASSPTFVGLTLSGAVTGVTTFSAGTATFEIAADGYITTYPNMGAGQDNYVLTYDHALGTLVLEVLPAAGPHTHDTDVLQIDGINSNIGAFPFDTTGIVTFNQDVTVPNLITAGNVDGVDVSSLPALIAANTTVVEVEAVITAELVGGQSIDNAIDTLIGNHAGVEAAHGMEADDLTDVSATGTEIDAMCDAPVLTFDGHVHSRDPGTTVLHDNAKGFYASGAGAGGYYYWGMYLTGLVVGKTVTAVRALIYDDIAGATKYAYLIKYSSAGVTNIDTTPDSYGANNVYRTIAWTDNFTVALGESYVINIKEAIGDPIRIVAIRVDYA